MNENKVREVFSYTFDDRNAFEDINNRRLFLNDIIDSNAIDYVAYNIMKFNREDLNKPVELRDPIKLYINTCGGDQSCGFGLIDVILQSETPVYTINQATCYSMGFLIFISGKKRYTMEHSTFLCHDGMNGAIDSVAKLKDRIEFETGQMEDKVREYIIGRTLITEEVYKEMYRKEWYMYPEEAKKLDIVTDIVGVDCKLDEII